MEFTVKTFDELTTRELYELLKARAEIFGVRENCAYQDMDDIDFISTHVFSQNGAGKVTAYLRLFRCASEPGTVQMGRVLTIEHGRGHGALLLRAGIDAARRMGAKKIALDARVHTIGFYAREGFTVCSEEFYEVGVPHVKMELPLSAKQQP